MKQCEICGEQDDLFSAVTEEPVCSICAIKYKVRFPVSTADIERIKRLKFGVKKDGATIKPNNSIDDLIEAIESITALARG